MRSCDIKTSGQPQTGRSMMQHLAYQPLLPSGNKYLQQKWDKASYDLHREKVKSAKPTINITPPQTYNHLVLKLKKHKLEEEWTMKIQRENNMLLEKISHIMRTTGAVDNKNYYDKKSLSKEKRQLELLRITNENQMILYRLNQCRPHYSVRSWHEDWLKTLKVMDCIARYPRGSADKQKEKREENPIKKNTDYDNNKTTTTSTTHSPAGNQANDKATCNETDKRKKDVKGAEGQQDIVTNPPPESKQPDKSISPGPPESPGSSNTDRAPADNPPDTADTCSSPEGSESSNPQTSEGKSLVEG